MQRTHPLLTLAIRLLLLVALANLALAAAQPVRGQACTDAAEIVEQSFDPPAAQFAPASAFTVSWTLENVGDCTWSRTYRVIFVSGDRLDGARTTRLRADVAPGENVTLSLELTAPADPAAYTGTWRLRNRDGSTFGPDLTVAIEVGSDSASAAATDVVLPEVLAFGGMGGAGDAEAINFCLEFGVLPGVPALVVDYEALVYHYTSLYICSLPEGTTVTVDVTDPEGNVFSRDFVEDEPVTAMDDAGNEYTSTVLAVHLNWIEQAPRGEWVVEVYSEDFYDIAFIEVLPQEVYAYATLDNWPLTPIDPFIAAESCNYGYLPGESMMISGANLLPNTEITVGVYQDRMSFGYLIDQFTVESDANGEFVIEYAAWSEVGSYTLMILNQEMLPGYTVEAGDYNLTYAGEHASGCAQVITPEEPTGEPAAPLRLLYNAGQPEGATIEVMDLRVGQGYPLTVTDGQCQTIEAAWWPDGEWVIYQSNCIRTPTDDGWYEMSASADYDLYATMLDFEFLLPEEETLVRLTATPDLHEMEPDADADGLIVYTQMAVGDDLGGSGELHLLDVFEESDVALGLFGRAPTWSPDGTRIAFMSDIDGTWQIYAYDFERESVWLVSRDCETHCRLPAWSPDGKEIIYHQATALDDFTPTGIWIAPARGIARPRLFLAGEFGRPSWSDAGWIVFQGPEGIYRASDDVAAGEAPEYHRYLYGDPEVQPIAAPVWSR